VLVELAGKLWRRLPQRVRRWGVMLKESRFTVTVGAVVMDEENRILLLKHRFRSGSGWGIPGGFLQPGEQPEDALRRELCEEVGLEIEELKIAFVRTLQRYSQVEIIFRCRPGSDFHPQNHEIIRAAWFALNAFPPDLSDDQRGLIQRVLKKD
jgi:8-oxo-dGTP diphosphatase